MVLCGSYDPVNLASDFVGEFPDSRVAWATKARVTLQRIKVDRKAATEKDYALALMSAKKALHAKNLEYSENLPSQEVYDNATECWIEVFNLSGIAQDEAKMTHALIEFVVRTLNFVERIELYLLWLLI